MNLNFKAFYTEKIKNICFFHFCVFLYFFMYFFGSLASRFRVFTFLKKCVLPSNTTLKVVLLRKNDQKYNNLKCVFTFSLFSKNVKCSYGSFFYSEYQLNIFKNIIFSIILIHFMHIGLMLFANRFLKILQK